MRYIPAFEAKAHFSALIDDAARDELALAMARFVVANGAHVPTLFASEAQNIFRSSNGDYRRYP